MKTIKNIVGRSLAVACCLFALSAQAAEKTVKWTLPSDWSDAIHGVGEVGSPDLPAFRHTVTMPKGSVLKGVTFEAEWERVDGVPTPVAAPVTSGQKLVYPEPGPKFNEVYPASAAYALEAMISGNKILQPIVITPYKWDGTTKTLYKATKLEVTIVIDEKKTLKLTTSSVDETEGEVLILSPHDFVSLWQGYAAFRKSTDAGKNFTFIVKDTKEIYDYPGLTDREKTDYALALHHYIETNFYKAASCDKQYVILGASPAKTATFNPNTMIPKRDFFGDSGTSTHDYNQAGDMYYGCMERLKNGAIDPTVEVWDVGNDGVYWATNSVAPYGFDDNKSVDWTMEIAVTRVPLLERSVEKLNGNVIEVTASDMMNSFTNRIAWAESAAFETTDRGKAYVGGNENEGNQKGGKDERYTGERTFFDGITNMFDPSRNGKITSDEWGPRDRIYNIMGKVQPQRDAKIIANNISNTDIAGAYANRGDLATFYSHGDWREYGNLSASRAYQGGGFYAVYATSFSCMSGKYDTNGDGAGITNALCFGEAPIVAPVTQDGALVTLTSARDGWSGGFGTLSMYLDELFLKALYGLVDGVPMNAAQAGKYAHNTYAASAYGTTSAHGSVLGHAILCGDPLIKVYMMPNRTELTGYSRNLSVSTASSKTFNIADDVAAARAAFSDAGNQTLTLEGTGKFRTTDTLTVTNVANLVWSVAGGAGRNGITFSGTKGNLTLGGTATRYFGPKLTNVGNIAVTGGNVTLDFDTTACSFDELEFVSQDDVTANPNILRTRKEGFIPATQTIPVVNSALKLQTINVGGNTAALKETPLFYVTNGVLTVESNPYWGTEYFVRPTYLCDAKLLGEYTDFGLGRPDSNGYDLYVDGTSEIGGSTPIKVTGELRLHLEDAATTLTITNALANGHNGAAGSLALTGSGTVKIVTPQTFTGGITVGSGVKLVLGIANAVVGDITVQDGGKLELQEAPLVGAVNLKLLGSAALVLPHVGASGVYQVVDSSLGTITADANAKVYDANSPSSALTGSFSNGYYLPTSAVLTWGSSGGSWDTTTTNWKTAGGSSTAFADGKAVKFDATGYYMVSSSSAVQPSSMEVSGSSYTFSVSSMSGLINPSAATFASSAKFYVPLHVDGALKITGGNTEFEQSFGEMTAQLIEVGSGASLRLGAGKTLRSADRKVRALRFTFTATKSDGNRAAVQELRLFNRSGRFKFPVDTIIRDSNNEEIKITGESGEGHTYTWIKSNHTSEDESLKALIDGSLGNNNKWWPDKQSMPVSFEIVFPSDQSMVTGYNLCMADHKPRNPKSWTVEVSTDGTIFKQEASEAGHEYDIAKNWVNSDGSVKAFDLMSPNGRVVIKTGGALLARGNMASNLAFEDGAVLKVTQTSKLSCTDTMTGLTLPASGTVIVNTDDATQQTTFFEILSGYNLDTADIAKFKTASTTAALSIQNGNLYVVTSGVKQPPYTAELSSPGANVTWANLGWRDGSSAAFTWNDSVVNVPSGTATVQVVSLATGGTTIDLGTALSISTVKLTGGSTETLTLSWSANFIPLTIDLSTYNGKVILNTGSYALASTEIIAGRDTWVTSSSCMSKLTIGAGMRAIVNYPWNGTKTVAAGGTFGYGNDTTPTELTMGDIKVDGAYLELAGTHVIKGSFESSTDGSKIISSGTVSTKNGDNEVCLAGNQKSVFEVSGGTFTLGGRVFTVRNGTAAINITGGSVVSTASKGFLYNGGGFLGGVLDLNISGGTFGAMYGPYHPSSGNSGIKDNTLRVNVSGTGVFAPIGIRYSSDGNYPSSDNSSTDISGSKHSLNMTGGTFNAPATVPNWLPINVTAGTANLGAQNSGTTTIRSTATISSGATLNITAGTINFAGSGALKGTGTLAIGSGATFTTAYGSLSNNVTVAAGGTLNLTGAALTESGITITEGTFSKEDGATLQINGTELDMTQWTIEGNRIVKRQSGQYGPLMSERWHQHNPFNWFAAYVGGNYTPCGCVAMGVGQMFHYYRWPVRTDTVTEAATTYQTGGVVTPFPLAVDGKNPFLWDEMRDYASACTLTGQYEAARMILWCDALAKMCFQPGGSNTALYYVPESVSYWYEKGEELLPSAGDHRERLKTELAAGRPIQTTIDGHQVVIDGWRSSDNKFHVNWGQEDSDPGKTTWFDVTQSTLGSWSVSSFWIGIAPRKMAQIQTLPKLGPSTVTLAWDVPAVHTNAITGFTVKDYTCADAVTNYSIPGTNELSYTRADYYPIPGVYGATESATFACTVHSSNTKALIVDVQVRYDGGPWQTFATPTLSTEESYEDPKTGQWIDKTIATNILLNLSAKAGKAAEFRIKTTRTGNSFASEYTGPYLRLYNCAWTNVHASVAAVEHAVGATARSLEISGLAAGSYHSFTVTPTIEGAVESEPMGMRVAAASQEIPALPEILRVETMGSPITDGFVREVKPGAIVFFVKGSETVTGVSAAISHPGLVATNLVRVKSIPQGNWYAIEIDAPESITVNSRMILTIAATDAYENRAVKDLMLVVSNTIEDDNDGQLMSALDQENAVIVPPDVTNHLESTFDQPLVGAGTVIFNNTLPEGTTLIQSLQNSFAWHGTVRMVDCPAVQYPQMYKNDNSFLVEEKSPTPPEPEPEPDPNEMYHNTLCASNEEVKVARGTYGTAIEVPTNGYYATAFTSNTTLSTTASASIGGNYANIIKDGTYIDTHTVVGWFNVGALPTDSSLKVIYIAQTGKTDGTPTTAEHCGYKLAVDKDGKLYVGKIKYDSGMWSWQANDTYKATSASAISGDGWFHIAVANVATVSGSTKTVTPKIFVNGQEVEVASGTFAGNLNGNTCVRFYIGAGISAAGVYVDTTALSDAAKVASFATNAYYVVKGAQPMPEPTEPLSQMYFNRLSTGSTFVTSGAHGSITVPGDGYCATAYSSATVLDNSASDPERGGAYTSVIVTSPDCNINTHTVAGWFKIDSLPTGSNKQILWSCQNGNANYRGYAVAVNASGELGISRTTNASLDFEDNNNFSSGVGIQAGVWYHIAFSIKQNGTADPNRNAEVQLFVNGEDKGSLTSSNKLKIGCNGGATCSSFTIAADVSAAGVYVDTQAFAKAATVRYLATCSTYLKPYVPTPPGPTGDIHATISSAVNWSAIEWYDASEQKIGTVTDFSQVTSAALTIANAGVVTIDNWSTISGLAAKLTIGGVGRIAYTTSGTTTAYPTWTWKASGEDAWTGTYALSGYDGEVQNWNPTTYFNGTASKFEFGGTVKTKGWFWQSSSANNMFGELVLTGTINFTDGHTHPKDDNDPILHYCFTKLSGNGNITINTSSSATTALRFSDVSAYTGALSVDSTNGSGNGYRVFLGDGTLAASGNNPTRVAIHVTGNATLGTATYTAKNGIFVHNPASVGGTATLASNATFDADAEIDARNGVLTANGTLTFGATTKVRVATTPMGDVKIINKSGTTAGDISTTVSVYVGESTTAETRDYSIKYKTDGVYLIPGESPYAKFSENPAVLTYNGAGTFHTAYFVLFDTVGGTNTTTTYNGNASSGTIIPGQTAVIDKSWKVFSANANTDNGKYVAPGYVLRFASGIGTAQVMDADFDPLSIGGMVVESGATGWSFVSNKGNAARATQLGDNRATGGVPTWFVFNESFAFNRYSSGYKSFNTLTLWGEINFEIAEGKTVSLNTDTSKGCPNPQLDTTTSAQVKMHGAGTLAANLNATGAVTLDYTDIPLSRETAYISGTLTINDATVIKLPADLPENTPFKMATTLSGANSGERTIWIGETQVTKNVTFADGTISYSTTVEYKSLGWNGSAWTNAAGVVTAVDSTCILNAKDGDVITFSSAVSPHAFNMPQTGTVTINDQQNLSVSTIAIPSAATLVIKANNTFSPALTGSGTLSVNPGQVKFNGQNNLPASKFTNFTGKLQMATGRLQDYSAVLPSAVTIEILNGAQMYFGTALTWENDFIFKGDGWTGESNVWIYGPARFDRDVTLSGSVTFDRDNVAPQILIASGKTLALSGAVSAPHGFTTAGSSGTIKLTTVANDTITGTVTLNTGDLWYGTGNSGGTAGTSYKCGDTIVVGTGRTFNLHPWKGTEKDDSESNKVILASDINVQGGTFHVEDGSYVFSGDFNVVSNSTLSFKWAKGRVIKSLKGGSGVTLTVNSANSDKSVSMNYFKGGDFAGTLNLTGSGTGAYLIPYGTALSKATVSLESGWNVCLTQDATIGTLSGSLDVFGDGTASPTLTLKGGNYSGAFKDTSSGAASGTPLSLTIAGEVAFSGGTTYTGTTTISDTGILTMVSDTQRTLKALAFELGGVLIVNTNATTAAVAVTDAVDLTGGAIRLANVLPAEGGTIKLLSSSGGISNYENALEGRGDWTLNYADNTLTATKAKATYVTPGEGGVVTNAGNNANSLDISMTLAKKVTKDMEKKVTDESSAADVTDALNQTGKNTYKVWESAVLGLDPNDANSQLVIKPIQTSNASKVTLQVPEVNVDTTTGADVTFCFYSKTADSDWTEVQGGVVESGEAKELELPETGVKYYQLRTTIKTSKQAAVPTVIPSANIVASGMPLTTGTGSTQYAASLGTKTLDAAADYLQVELAGAGVYEGQEYHLEITEPETPEIKAGALKLTTSSVDDNASGSHFAIVAKATAQKMVLFNFGRTVNAGTTCKLTLLSTGGAPTGDVRIASDGVTGAQPAIVTAIVADTPVKDGLAESGFNSEYRIPSLVSDGAGEVICCYDVRYGATDLGYYYQSIPAGGIDIGETFSANGGVTFGSAKIGVDVPNFRRPDGVYPYGSDSSQIAKTNDMGDVAMLYDPSTQKYWMMGITGGGLSTVRYNPDTADVVLYTRGKGADAEWTEWENPNCTSTDHWEKRSLKWDILNQLGITTGDQAGSGFLQGPGHGMVTQFGSSDGTTIPVGTLVFPVQYFINGSKVGAIYSKDHGQHWTATQYSTEGSSPQENCVMELDDGSWYMSAKAGVRSAQNGRVNFFRTTNYSTWTYVGEYGPVPCQQGSCIRLGKGSDGKGRYALCHTTDPDAATRAKVAVMFGVDTTSDGNPTVAAKGITWDFDNKIMLYYENTGFKGYNSMCMVDDHTLGILYEAQGHIYFTRIDVSDKVVPLAK